MISPELFHMGPDEGPGLLVGVTGVHEQEEDAVERRGSGYRVLPPELPGVHEGGKDVGLDLDALVPVERTVDIPAPLVGELAEKEQAAEAEKADQAHELLFEQLSAEQREMMELCEDVANSEATRENEYYYRAGFRDGVSLDRLIKQIREDNK